MFVVHVDGADAGLGGGHRFGHDGGNPLAAEPHHVVEDAGVVGVVGVELVLGAGKQLGGSVLVREDGHDAGHGRAPPALSMDRIRACACGERTSFRCKQPGQLLGRDVQGVAGPVPVTTARLAGAAHVVAELPAREPRAGGLAVGVRRDAAASFRLRSGDASAGAPPSCGGRTRRPRWPGSRCSGRGCP